MNKRFGGWLQTSTGRLFWPLDPRPEEVYVEDVAHALSHLCRFGGHALSFYSVAQHCCLVSYLVPPEHALAGLLHDATEAYLVDIPSPVKRFLPEYQNAESRLYVAIAERFALPAELPHCIHVADKIALATEKRDLMLPESQMWEELPEPHGQVILPWDPVTARENFLRRFDELGGCR